MAELIDKTGKCWKIWGYGIDSIMKNGVPSMLHLKKYFPHVPNKALKGLIEKEVDILVGLNLNHLMPAGGKGKNKKQGMRSKISLFVHEAVGKNRLRFKRGCSFPFYSHL